MRHFRLNRVRQKERQKKRNSLQINCSILWEMHHLAPQGSKAQTHTNTICANHFQLLPEFQTEFYLILPFFFFFLWQRATCHRSLTFLWNRLYLIKTYTGWLGDTENQTEPWNCWRKGTLLKWKFGPNLFQHQHIKLIGGKIITIHEEDPNNAKASSKSCSCILQYIKDTSVWSQAAPLKSANTITAVRMVI